jgi:hypothetical protein
MVGHEGTVGIGRATSETGKTVIPNLLAYYAELGFRVFPNHYKKVASCSCKQGQLCEKAGKHPAIKGYQHLASSTFEDITTSRDLFGGRFRNYDIGALTGFEWFVLDSDDGEVEGVPETWKSKSASRGFHYFFRVPQGTTIRNIHKVIPGADIKGRGGLVVLPSEVNNREWVNAPHETGLADSPEWLLEAIQNHERIRNEIVRVAVEEKLDELPEVYTEEAYWGKCDAVYQHIYDHYYGQGKSVYAEAS